MENSVDLKNVLLVYNNPDEKDQKTSKILEVTKQKLKDLKLKVESINIDQLQFITEKQSTSQRNSNNGSNSQTQTNVNTSTNLVLVEKDKAESMKKINKADLVCFIFPLTWGSVPSRMKIWTEVCYNEGLGSGLINENSQIYSNGKMKGKFAVILCSSENCKQDYGYKGKFILSFDEILEHFTHGVLALYGYSVLPNFVVYNDKREKINVYYDELKEFLTTLTKKEIVYNSPINIEQ